MKLILFLDTCYLKRSLLIGMIYHRPNGIIGSCLNELEIILNNIYTPWKACVVVGDLYINKLINSKKKQKNVLIFLPVMATIHIINKPTRASTHSAICH